MIIGSDTAVTIYNCRLTMKNIKVVAAVIHDAEGRIFATQRGYGDMAGGWEFPGGKIEAGETAQQALHREIGEELDTDITIEKLLDTVEWDYPTFHLTLHCFLCRLQGKPPVLREHKAALWLTPKQLGTVEWLPADQALVRKLSHNLTAGASLLHPQE